MTLVTYNGLIGVRLHKPITIQARSAYGFYFAYVIIIYVFWYGIGTYTGAECIQSMILAIWLRFRDVPNQLPESANITTRNDFARYPKKPNSPYIQLLVTPIVFIAMMLFGIIGAK
ncbi:hypothetical protein DL95DRAFT_456875 [Leptodontidium sp. 2 PMI_412]|nr:hypothetical protein DL95DRAFT_456875 [Leptodontidium sp. 2 PMI_412]